MRVPIACTLTTDAATQRLDFAVEIDCETATLVVGVPADAAPVLDDFAALLKGSTSLLADT